jgi:hypothetical protein
MLRWGALVTLNLYAISLNKMLSVMERALVTLAVLLTIYYLGYQRKGNEMGRACATNGGEEKCIQDYGGAM